MTYPYSILVGISGTVVYAQDSNGNIISGGYGVAGVDDAAVIQAAINQCSGILFIRAGTYILSNYITLKSNVHIIGEGRNSTILRLANSTNINQFIRGYSISYASLKSLQIDYNHQNNPSCQEGMHIETSSYVTVDDVLFNNARGFALGFAGDNASRNNHITVTNNVVINPTPSPNDMFLVTADFGIVHGNRIVGCTNNISLVLYESYHLLAHDNTVELGVGAGTTGIGVLSCVYANVHDNRVVGPGVNGGIGVGIYTEHDNPYPITSERNNIHNNGVYNVGTGIQMSETSNDQIHDNRIDYANVGLQFPTSTHPAASSMNIYNNKLLNVTKNVDNSAGATYLPNTSLFM